MEIVIFPIFLILVWQWARGMCHAGLW